MSKLKLDLHEIFNKSKEIDISLKEILKEALEKGISEMYRVLRPGGHVMILELSTPAHFPMKQLYKIYSNTVIPFIGRFLSKEKTAYHYLPASIKVVPQGKEMTAILTKCGFKEAKFCTFTFGICSMYTGIK